MINRLRVRKPFQPMVEATPIPEDTILMFQLVGGILEVRYVDDGLEISALKEGQWKRLTIEPGASNQCVIRIDAALA